MTSDSRRARALSIVQQAQRAANAARPQLDFTSLTLRGKKTGLEKVIKMIGERMADLKAEQLADDEQLQLRDQRLREGPAVGAGLGRAAGNVNLPSGAGRDQLQLCDQSLQKGQQWEQALS